MGAAKQHLFEQAFIKLLAKAINEKNETNPCPNQHKSRWDLHMWPHHLTPIPIHPFSSLRHIYFIGLRRIALLIPKAQNCFVMLFCAHPRLPPESVDPSARASEVRMHFYSTNITVQPHHRECTCKHGSARANTSPPPHTCNSLLNLFFFFPNCV